ncbi:hypothetical protein [Candidatus Vidania fulgoroideorum]
MNFILGNNINKSLSPIIYSFFFFKSNYKKISSKKKFFYLYFIYFIKFSFYSNITIPYKKTSLILSNYYSKRSKNSKSNNFLIKIKNSIYSYNSDGLGFSNTFKNLKIKKKINILFIGAGGAARSIFLEISKKKYVNKTFIYNRTKKKTFFFKKFKAKIKKNFYKKKVKKTLIINTIPSFFFQKLIYKKKINFKKCFIYDINYIINKTCDINGIFMLYEQALENYKIYKKNEKNL